VNNAERRTHTLYDYRGSPVQYPERKSDPRSVKWCQEWAKSIHQMHTEFGLPCDFTQQQIHAAHERVAELLANAVRYPASRDRPVTTSPEEAARLDKWWPVLFDLCGTYRAGMCMWQQPSLL